MNGDTPDPGRLADELSAIRAMLADHERRLFPLDRNNLPHPSGRIDNGGVTGRCWKVGRWVVICPDTEDDRGGCVYIHTPHSMHGPGLDVVAATFEDARTLAASILAAVNAATPPPAADVAPLNP